MRSKIYEVKCDIICIQETKREHFDSAYIRKFCPQQFDCFEYLPSIGASGGCLTIWKSIAFHRNLSYMNEYGLSMDFTCTHSGIKWILTNIYAPCTDEGKLLFLEWFQNVDMPADCNWLIVGDFNLMRSQEDRNKLGGNVNEMLLFNEAISAQGLIELPLQGRAYTWSNKQQSPLLERLDWFFTSSTWTTEFPQSTVMALSRDTSDHVPCLVKVAISVPKPKIFRFENFWMEHGDFLQVVQEAWAQPVQTEDRAKIKMAKFKNLRRELKHWSSNISNLAMTIGNTKSVINLIDIIEETRDLTLEEWNFREQLQEHLKDLLHKQNIYWR